MGGAVDHAFIDELGTARAEAADLDAEDVGNVSDAVGTNPKLSHGTQEFFLAGGEAVESDAEKVVVKALQGVSGGIGNDVEGHGAGGGSISCLVAPFLKEVGVALGEGDDLIEGIVLDVGPFAEDGVFDGLFGIAVGEGANEREREKPLGVGFRFASEPWQDGEAGSDEDERELSLLHAVHAHDEGTEFTLIEVLDFIDEDGDGGVAIFGDLGEGDEKHREVEFKISTIGGAGLGVDIDPDGDLIDGEGDATDEALEDGESAADFLLGSGEAVELEEKGADGRSEKRREGFPFVGFEENGVVSCGLADLLHAVEEDGFTDSSQAGEEEAFLGTAFEDASEEDFALAENFFPSDEFRGWGAGSGAEGIVDGVHSK
jgi:hypothetical protein